MESMGAGIIAGATFVILDGLWLGVFTRSLHKEQLGALMRPHPHWLAGGCGYLFMVAGFIWFVYPQIMMVRSVINVAQYGARFGVVLFGVYQCTNYAILTGWPSMLVIIDTMWGGVLYAAASVAVYYLRNIW